MRRACKGSMADRVRQSWAAGEKENKAGWAKATGRMINEGGVPTDEAGREDRGVWEAANDGRGRAKGKGGAGEGSPPRSEAKAGGGVAENEGGDAGAAGYRSWPCESGQSLGMEQQGKRKWGSEEGGGQESSRKEVIKALKQRIDEAKQRGKEEEGAREPKEAAEEEEGEAGDRRSLAELLEKRGAGKRGRPEEWTTPNRRGPFERRGWANERGSIEA